MAAATIQVVGILGVFRTVVLVVANILGFFVALETFEFLQALVTQTFDFLRVLVML